MHVRVEAFGEPRGQGAFGIGRRGLGDRARIEALSLGFTLHAPSAHTRMIFRGV